MQACEQSRHRQQPFGTCASQRPSTARRNLSVRPRGYHVRWRGRRERKPTTTPARDRSFGGTLAALWADDGPLEAPAVWWWCHKAVRGESDACVGTGPWCRGVDELRRTHCQNVGRTASTREACEYQLFTRYEQSTAQTSHAHAQPHTHGSLPRWVVRVEHIIGRIGLRGMQPSQRDDPNTPAAVDTTVPDPMRPHHQKLLATLRHASQSSQTPRPPPQCRPPTFHRWCIWHPAILTDAQGGHAK